MIAETVTEEELCIPPPLPSTPSLYPWNWGTDRRRGAWAGETEKQEEMSVAKVGAAGGPGFLPPVTLAIPHWARGAALQNLEHLSEKDLTWSELFPSLKSKFTQPCASDSLPGVGVFFRLCPLWKNVLEKGRIWRDSIASVPQPFNVCVWELCDKLCPRCQEQSSKETSDSYLPWGDTRVQGPGDSAWPNTEHCWLPRCVPWRKTMFSFSKQGWRLLLFIENILCSNHMNWLIFYIIM